MNETAVGVIQQQTPHNLDGVEIKKKQKNFPVIFLAKLPLTSA